MTSHFGCNFLLYTFAQPHPEPRLGPQAQASQNCEPGPRPCQAVTKARLGPAYVGLGPAGLGLQAGPCTSLLSISGPLLVCEFGVLEQGFSCLMVKVVIVFNLELLLGGTRHCG